MTPALKQRIVMDFLGGESIADVALFHGVRKASVEMAIREGFTGMVNLWNTEQQAKFDPNSAPLEPTGSDECLDIGSTPSEAV